MQNWFPPIGFTCQLENSGADSQVPPLRTLSASRQRISVRHTERDDH
jgi:hypothetical protein